MDILKTLMEILLIGIGCGLLGIPMEAGNEDLPLNALLGGICYGSYLYVSRITGNLLLATFAGSLTLAFLAIYLTRRTKKPMQVYLVTSIIPLLPGYNIFRMVLSFIEADYADSLQNANLTLQILALIAISLIIASSVTRILKRYFNPKLFRL